MRCARAFAAPACPWILCGAILARKAAVSVNIINHRWVSFYRSFHLSMPRKFNIPLLLFPHFYARFHDQALCFPYCGARKPSFGHFRQIQGEAHVWLFQLYPTSLPCHSSKHVENLQDISCCFRKWESAITSTIYASVASSKVFKASLVHSRWRLSPNSSAKMPELTTSWCSIPCTVWTKAFVNHGGFSLRAVKYWSRSSLRIPAAHYSINWWPCTMIWTYSPVIACCFLFVLHPVLQTVFKCASWVMFSVATLAAS